MRDYVALWFSILVLLFPSIAMAADLDLETKLDAAFEAGELDGLHSVLVMHRGDILAERYYPGQDETIGQDLGIVEHGALGLHDLRSVTKSITSLLYGIALSEGKVPGLDESLVAQFPEYPDLVSDPDRQKIKVRHALTMTTGLEWNENLPYNDPRNSEIAMEMAKDRYRFVLDRKIVEEPGNSWNYNGGATAIIARLIYLGTGKTLDEYASERLFAPLGITEFTWMKGRDGEPMAASGLRLTLPDLGKIGTLVLQKGKWEDTLIVPADWLQASTSPHAVTSSGIQYGYFWWLASARDPVKWVAGSGNGGQYLWTYAPTQLMVVVFAGMYNKPDAWMLPSKIVRDYAGPAAANR